MQANLQIMLATTVLIILYTWLGYPVILVLARVIVRRRTLAAAKRPAASIILAVFNEAEHISAKLENCLALDYPHDLFEIVVASDGSTDATDEIVREFATRDPRIKLVRSEGRAGKSGVQNLAVEQARGQILLFTDARAIVGPDLLCKVVDHLDEPDVGLVAPVVHFGQFGTTVSEGQGAYWRFELLLRQLESDLGILATCSGSAFAMRRKLFRPIPPQYGDDCVVPLDVRLQGYRIVQDRDIVVYDEMPHSVQGELRARVRMTARNWAGIFSRPAILNPLRFPGTAPGLISHKFLRWMTPFLLAALYFVNVTLIFQKQFVFFFIAQNCFYLAAIIGWRRSRRQPCSPMFGYPFAFCLANVGFFLGAVTWIRQQRIVAYK